MIKHNSGFPAKCLTGMEQGIRTCFFAFGRQSCGKLASLRAKAGWLRQVGMCAGPAQRVTAAHSTEEGNTKVQLFCVCVLLCSVHYRVKWCASGIQCRLVFICA